MTTPITENAKPFTLASHDESKAIGEESPEAIPCSGSLDLRLADCMDVMATFPDGHFDLAIVDPPYGIGESLKASKRTASCKGDGRWEGRKPTDYTSSKWDSESPPVEYFNELFRVSKHQIIWGANHFIEKVMKGSPSWIVWDKLNGDSDFADAELAYTSHKKATRIFKALWNGFQRCEQVDRIHPTQKPVKLYDWIFANYATPGMKVLDTHMGSGSIAIAAHYAGIHLTACEIDPDYFHAAKARIERETAQLDFFSSQNS